MVDELWEGTKVMLSSVANFAKFFIFFAIWLALAAAFFSYSKYVLARTFGRSVIQITSVSGLGDAATENRAAYLVARAQELGTPPRLDALYEVKVPPLQNHFGDRGDLKFLDDLKLSIQGVDLPATLRVLLSVLPDDQYTVSARAEANEPILRLEWREPSGNKRAWLLRLDPAVDNVKANDQPAANKVLFDRAIYVLLYHMYYDPSGPQRWREKMKPQDVRFPNARALEAYYAGQQRLNAYLRNPNETSELDAAESKFRVLQQEMPQFVDGLMLLGLTLSEKRNETGAIEVYERVEQQLRSKPNSDFDATKTLFQARLFKATAWRKLYRWEQLHKSIRELEQLQAVIESFRTEPLSKQQLFELQKIYVTVVGEKASGLGYYLILLYQANFIKALTVPSAPATIKPAVDRAVELAAIDSAVVDAPNYDRAAWNARFRALAQEMSRIYGIHGKTLELAKLQLNAISPPPQADWERERDKIVNLLSVAEGYALYRYAQIEDITVNLLDDSPEKPARLAEADTKFLENCRAALAKLVEADAAQPNHYIVLQDMGLIYADTRFDADHTYVPIAQRLFRRSTEIKPDDFFGYQYLAMLAVRQAYAEGAEFVQIDPNKKDPISQGIADGEKARKLRPEAGLILVALSQLYALRWSAEDNNAKPNTEALFNSTLAAAEQGHTSPLRVLVSRLQWSLLQLRKTADGPVFKTQQDTLLADLYLARVQAAKYPTWEGRKLLEITTKLDRIVKDATLETRFTMRWPD